VKEYVRLALSFVGQHIIEALKEGKQGYVALTPEEAVRELAKIE
jgi:hypothetical protein